MSKTLVFLEQREGNIKKASLEAVSQAVTLFGASQVDVLCIGTSETSLLNAVELGAAKISLHSHPELGLYSASAYTAIISQVFNSGNYTFCFLANTAMGKDIAPRLAIRAGAGLFTDCTALNADGTSVTATRPIYAGKAFQNISSSLNKNVVTLRPNVFPIINRGGSSTVEEISVSNPDLSNRVTEIKKAAGKLDVAEANIIVSGGRGMKGPENFHLIEALADSLGAAVGASRAVVDAGWRPHSEQVGQTGKTVSPSLYVAVGISGAIQHLAGMSSSKYIVAINKDKEAPIFSVADYGIAGDAFEILPLLTEEIKKLKQ